MGGPKLGGGIGGGGLWYSSLKMKEKFYCLWQGT